MERFKKVLKTIFALLFPAYNQSKQTTTNKEERPDKEEEKSETEKWQNEEDEEENEDEDFSVAPHY